MPFFTTQAEYAEDQNYAKPVLGIHVMDRGFQTGTILGLDVALAQFAWQKYYKKQFLTPQTFMKLATRYSGIGALAGATMFTLALPLYMRGKTQIEWQDRSWRLLGNAGQVEVDKWALTGEVLGAGSAFVPGLSKAANRTFVSVVGRASLGGLAGVMGYMIWRYGVHHGERTSTAMTQKADKQVLFA